MAAGGCRWLHRHVVFKCATAGLLLSAAVFLLGFSLPHWHPAAGLWSACGNTECAASLSVPWLGAVQGLLCLSLLGYILCISAEIYQDLLKVPPAPDNNAVEALALCTGLIGAILFASKAVDSHAAHLGWSFWLVMSSSILVLISAMVIALSRKFHAQNISQPPRTIMTPVSSVLVPDFQPTGILAPTIGRSKQASHKLGLSMDIPPPPYALPPPYPYTLVQFVPPQIVYPLPQITAPVEPKLST
ncbi:hypothetical protein C0Q70_02119 [Pomacea canaliculata]|uniref:Uncharacterized protein n=1 Tax=Pomacea canaliculata TaxID=400727 RepID=A0A2T7Q1C6_POMCA|nr:hypothetical protein C0Q70_02119 [Pomacea canaliculata]